MPAEDDRGADASDFYRIDYRLGGNRHDIDDDIYAASLRDRHHALDHVFGIGFDGVVGAKCTGDFELLRCARFR